MVRIRDSVRNVVVIILLALFIVLFVSIFKRLPIEGTSLALDWGGIWQGIEGGTINYGKGLRNPPWSIIPVLPFGLLSFRESWALLAIVTLGVLVISVPRNSSNRNFWFYTFLISTSFPTLRLVADGNLEALAIAGILIMLHGYRSRSPGALSVGILLASAKPQESWLFILAIALYSYQQWSLKRVATAFTIVVLFVAPSMLWVGKDWLQALISIEARGSIMDASLIAAMNRLMVSPWLIGIFWLAILIVTIVVVLRTGISFSRQKAGFLISASLLLSPYAAGNNMITVLAIGIIPLLKESPKTGLLMIVLINLQYFFLNSSIMYSFSAFYSTGLLLLSFLLLGGYVYRSETKPLAE
jgi:hypothetical protein